jgi:pimeloyl-ACP methyl ester carboxylesterase
VAPRLIAGFAVLAALLACATPATASTRAPAAAGPLVCVHDHCRGYISVPLDRTGFVPGHVELYVSEFVPKGESKGVVLELAGGPGQSSAYAFDSPVDLWDGWTQVSYDNRGTGQSSRIACGPFVGLDDRGDVTRCNDLLGPERAFYSTRDNAADMEAVRSALGVDKLAIWGTSYGTKQALAYAHDYPSHVDRLLLDSTLTPAGPDVYDLQYGRSVPTGLKALCGTALCTRATPDIAADVAAVANALAAKPIDAAVSLRPGKPAHIHLDGYGVVALAVSTDLSSQLANLLPSALRAAKEGRYAELERLWFLYADGSDDTRDSSDSFSEPVFTATMCDDGEFPWPAHTPVAARQALVDKALASLPSGAFGAFGPWLQTNSYSSICLGWESTGLSPLASTGFPDVPVLVVSGDRDIRTPTENGVAVAHLFPRGHLLVSHGSGHSVLSYSDCADDAVGDWLRGATPAAECDDDQDHFVLPLVPGSVTAAPALAPGGKVGRTLAAVVATIDELHTYGRLADSFSFDDDDSDRDPGSALVAGLVGGAAGFERMKAYADVPGVTLSGSSILDTSHATFTVGGSAAAHGTLRYTELSSSGRCTLKGTLGGRKVSTRC